MSFPVSGALLDACVLGLLSENPSYGYDLTQRIQSLLSVSESTLYPVLRRLRQESLLRTYDAPYDGRIRRYYQITEAGREMLRQYRKDWLTYKKHIEQLIGGQTGDER